MTRLIDAERLIKVIGKAQFEGWGNIMSIINDAPTVEVGYLTNCTNCERVEKIRAERPHGKWIKVLKPYGGFGDQVLMIECSKCHTELVYHGKKPKYCLECGADMKEADNEC